MTPTQILAILDAVATKHGCTVAALRNTRWSNGKVVDAKDDATRLIYAAGGELPEIMTAFGITRLAARKRMAKVMGPEWATARDNQEAQRRLKAFPAIWGPLMEQLARDAGIEPYVFFKKRKLPDVIYWHRALLIKAMRDTEMSYRAIAKCFEISHDNARAAVNRVKAGRGPVTEQRDRHHSANDNTGRPGPLKDQLDRAIGGDLSPVAPLTEMERRQIVIDIRELSKTDAARRANASQISILNERLASAESVIVPVGLMGSTAGLCVGETRRAA